MHLWAFLVPQITVRQFALVIRNTYACSKMSEHFNRTRSDQDEWMMCHIFSDGKSWSQTVHVSSDLSVYCSVLNRFYTVSQKKRHPFYFCDIFVRSYPILLIFGRNIPQEIWNKRMCTPNSSLVLCVRTVPCKNWRRIRTHTATSAASRSSCHWTGILQLL